mmetsp:Transcript_13627/g.43785  ORF Transcript_13627/g.43785 Transcript_13627/m.43785 type:complete len:254 (-) Transcript_13627:1298-2059(-)
MRGYEPAVPGVGARWPLQEQPGVHAAELPAVVRRVSDARQRGGGGRQRLRGRPPPARAYQPLFDAAADRAGVVRVAECSDGPYRTPRGDVRPRRGPPRPLGHSPGPQPPPPHRPAPRLLLPRRHRRGIPPDAAAPALPPHPRPPHPPPCHPGAVPRGGGAAPSSHRRQAGARGPQAKVSTRSTLEEAGAPEIAVGVAIRPAPRNMCCTFTTAAGPAGTARRAGGRGAAHWRTHGDGGPCQSTQHTTRTTSNPA